ncbi:carboxymuconolactone decarboxylase family protein [Microbacterium sp. NPDC077644]|uniref:carboxymuconolactone decarboxylase family protein n=1 Tax=Microbacterium sp. NPDC077644 TaxID=3155055 RepID=UPI00344DB755
MDDEEFTIEKRLERGREFADRMRPGMNQFLVEHFNGPSADFGRYLTEWAFGEVWQREGLSIRDREIAILGVLIGGGYLKEVRAHVRIAVNLGLTRNEVAEIAMQSALYVGMPRAGEIFALIEEALPIEQFDIEGRPLASWPG